MLRATPEVHGARHGLAEIRSRRIRARRRHGGGRIQVAGSWRRPYSPVFAGAARGSGAVLPGDSGSLITGADLRAVALLFAGSDQGGANGQGLTYANPIRTVLDSLSLKVAL